MENYKLSDWVNVLDENGFDGQIAMVSEITKKGYKLLGIDNIFLKGFYKDKQLRPTTV